MGDAIMSRHASPARSRSTFASFACNMRPHRHTCGPSHPIEVSGPREARTSSIVPVDHLYPQSQITGKNQGVAGNPIYNASQQVRRNHLLTHGRVGWIVILVTATSRQSQFIVRIHGRRFLRFCWFQTLSAAWGCRSAHFLRQCLPDEVVRIQICSTRRS